MEEKSNHMTKKTLANFSVVLWAISLLLVGFHARDTWYGLMILLFSPLAFLGGLGGLAAYANWFYWWVCLRLALRKQPFIATFLMMGLALLTLVFEEPLGASGSYASVQYWGYGAVVWGFSLLVMAAAVWDKRLFHSRKQVLKPYMIVFVAMMLGLFGLKLWQWQHANIYERKQYLPFQAAFGMFKPSGEHFVHNPFPENLPHTDVPLEVVGDIVFSSTLLTTASIQVGEQNFKLPNVFLYQGHKIINTSHYFIVEKSDIQAKYRYRVENMGNEKARLSLYDVAQQKEIWHSEESLKKYERLFDAQIKTVFRQPEYKEPAKQSLPPKATFTETCPIAPAPNLTTYALRWDNKVSFFETERYLTLFCQDNMVLVMNVGDWSHLMAYPREIYVLQRDNMAYLGIFQLSAQADNKELKRLFSKYKPNIVPHIQSIELNGQDLLMKHEFGTTLFHKQKKD